MIKHEGTGIINTNRLVLRKFKVDDSEAMYKNWASDNEATKFLSWSSHPNIDHTKWIIESWISEYEFKDTYHWAIQLKDNGEVIGDIAIFNIRDKHASCEVGYCLSRKFWNMGIMSEALLGVIDYLFSEVGFNRIVAMHNTKNIASGKVMIKNNMKYEGTLREANNLGESEEFYDLNIYSILKSEYKRVIITS